MSSARPKPTFTPGAGGSDRRHDDVTLDREVGATQIGRLIAERYRIVRLIGRGGMGSVWEAVDTSDGAAVALKLLQSGGMAQGPAETNDTESERRIQERISRFYREARTASLLDQRHIVSVRDSGTDGPMGEPYIVMELLVGEDLSSLLKRVEVLPPETATRIVMQACEGLVDVHRAGIVHRDIKPGNLFLAEDEDGEIVVKILDFGLAKLAGETDPENEVTILTRAGRVLGSPQYMAPEQAEASDTIDVRADVWSLGAVLYSMLCGTTPYGSAQDVRELVAMLFSEKPKPVEALAPWVRPGLAAIVMRTLQSVPERRLADAEQLYDALSPYARGDTELRKDDLARAPALRRRGNLEPTASMPAPPPPPARLEADKDTANRRTRRRAGTDPLSREDLRAEEIDTDVAPTAPADLDSEPPTRMGGAPGEGGSAPAPTDAMTSPLEEHDSGPPTSKREARRAEPRRSVAERWDQARVRGQRDQARAAARPGVTSRRGSRPLSETRAWAATHKAIVVVLAAAAVLAGGAWAWVSGQSGVSAEPSAPTPAPSTAPTAGEPAPDPGREEPTPAPGVGTERQAAAPGLVGGQAQAMPGEPARDGTSALPTVGFGAAEPTASPTAAADDDPYDTDVEDDATSQPSAEPTADPERPASDYLPPEL